MCLQYRSRSNNNSVMDTNCTQIVVFDDRFSLKEMTILYTLLPRLGQNTYKHEVPGEKLSKAKR